MERQVLTYLHGINPLTYEQRWKNGQTQPTVHLVTAQGVPVCYGPPLIKCKDTEQDTVSRCENGIYHMHNFTALCFEQT